jgi:hypothetical protein
MTGKRGVLIYPAEAGPYWLELLRDSGLNLLGIHPAGGKDAALSLAGLLEFIQSRPFQSFAHNLAEAGIELEYEMHALGWLVPRDLFSKHPDWFRQNEAGQRTPDYNICPSNKQALAYLAERAADLASRLYLSSDSFSFWPDDVSAASCSCSSCTGLSPADQSLILTNTMLEAIKGTRPVARMSYLAYMASLAVPENVKPEPGVFLEYAPIRRNSFLPINDPDSPENKKETAAITDLLSFFGQRHSRVLEYWLDNSRFSNWQLPLKELPFNEDLLAADVKFYLEQGFLDLTSFACYLGPDYAASFGQPPIKRYGQLLRQGQ